MYTTNALRNRLKYLRDTEENPAVAGKKFIGELYEQLGIRKRIEGSDVLEEHYGEDGNRAKVPGTVSARDFSIADLSEMIHGREEHERRFNPERTTGLDVLEAGVGQDPRSLLNSSIYDASIAGLIEAEVLSDYDGEPLIGLDMVQTRNTNKNGQYLKGLYGDGGLKADLTRRPNEPHSRGEITDRKVKTPETVEKSRAIDLTKEAIYFDETGDLLDAAASVRDTILFDKNDQILRGLLGITNTYNYNDVAYNTFLTSGAWINDQVNPFTDHNDIDDAIELFTKLTHPATERPISMASEAMTVLHDPRKESQWSIHTSSTQLRQTNSGTQVITNQKVESIRNIKARYSSARVRQLLQNEGSMSETNAIATWFCGNPMKAFAWMQNWPLQVETVRATEYDMIDRGLYASYFANQRGTLAVLDPRFWHRQRNA